MGRAFQPVWQQGRLVKVVLGLTVVGAVVFRQQPAMAQSPAQPPRPYDGIKAGLDVYRQAEQQRQAAVSQQLYSNDQLRVWNGVPPSGAAVMYFGYGNGYGGPTYAAYAPAAAPATAAYAPSSAGGPLNAIPPMASLDYGYGFGYTLPVGAVTTPWGTRSVFEPWPYVAGDIYGFPFVPHPVRQPIGRYEVQTSPTHWESGPVYMPPAAPVQPPLATPTSTPPPGTESPPTADKAATGPIPPPPPPRPATGPREY